MATQLQEFVDLDDLKNLPKNVVSTFLPRNIIARGYPIWRKGDTDAFFALWADNLATQLSVLAVILGLPGMPNDFVYKNMMPGVGISLFFGNVYYALQASRKAAETGDMNVTAQPYGINTPGAFAKVFGIFFAVYFNSDPSKNYGFKGSNGPETAEKAWKISCACNFIAGLIELLGSLLAPFVSKTVPTVVYLAPIAGIGLAWLHFQHFIDIFRYPLETFVPFLLMWIAFFGGVKSKYFPVGLLSIIVGCIMCWITGYNTRDKLDAAGKIVKGYPGAFGVCFEEMGEVGNFVNILIPIALTNAVGTLMCVRSAKEAGDQYSPMETMMVDGLGTMLGALFGSPFGTTVYIGHPAMKKMGASRGFSMLNGLVYLIMGFTGLHAVTQAIIGQISVYPVLCYVGLYIGQQICELTPPRWFAAMLLGVLITFSDWAVTSFNDASTGMPALGALGLMKEGYLFTTVCWTWAFCMLTDRKFLKAALVFTEFFAFMGLVHSSRVSFEYKKHGSIRKGLPPSAIKVVADNDGLPGWKYILGYNMMAATCVLLFLMQKAKLIDPEVDGPNESTICDTGDIALKDLKGEASI